MKNENERNETTEASGVASSDLFGDFWKVAVLIRKQDKSLIWQLRCAFKIESEALDYAERWNGLAKCKIISPNTKMMDASRKETDL